MSASAKAEHADRGYIDTGQLHEAQQQAKGHGVD
jgi:hypothetical protein